MVDLGYGAAHWTASELLDRLRAVNPRTRVVGLEIDPARVAAATPYERDGLSFARGGFEVPLPDGERATVIRALNVLRQYDESEVAPAWSLMSSRLQPGGIVVDGTSNEIGRVASWIAVDATGPQSFTLSLRLTDLEHPGVVAERLPKALIHRNVPGERIHAMLSDLDRLWLHTAGYAEFGAQQRWLETVRRLADHGWTITTPQRRRRLGELTVPWSEVAPLP